MAAPFLSPHLTFVEWTYNRYNIPNVPSDQQVARGAATATELFETFRTITGPLRCNSGFRSPPLNELVDGNSQSPHLLGEAIDVTPVVLTMATLSTKTKGMKLCEFVDKLLPKLDTWDQIIVYPSRCFVHLALKSDEDGQRARTKNRKQVLLSPSKGRYVTYSIDNLMKCYPEWY